MTMPCDKSLKESTDQIFEGPKIDISPDYIIQRPIPPGTVQYKGLSPPSGQVW